MGRNLLRFTVLAFSATLSSPFLGAELSLAQINSIASEWRESFHTLRVVFDHTDLDQNYDHTPIEDEAPPISGLAQRFEFVWSEEGRVRSQYWQYEDRSLKHHSDFGSDGRVHFEAEYLIDNGAVGSVGELTLRREHLQSPGLKWFITPLLGIWESRNGEWGIATLSGQSAKVLGTEMVEGEETIRISDGERVVNVFPKQSCLPKRVSGNPEVKEPSSLEMIVDEYRGLLGGLPFPVRGRFSIANEEMRRWTVVSVEVNVPLPKDFFSPPKGAKGTIVRDRITGKGFTIGVSDEVSPMEIAAQANASRLSKTGKPVVAVVPNSTPHRIGFWLVVLGVFSAILAFVKRTFAPTK